MSARHHDGHVDDARRDHDVEDPLGAVLRVDHKPVDTHPFDWSARVRRQAAVAPALEWALRARTPAGSTA